MFNLDGKHDLLVRGIAAAKAGDIQEAKFYLNWVQNMESVSMDDRIDAWYWLSEITQDPKEKRNYLESILVNDPFEPRARRKLALLDGTLTEKELVDPEKLPIQSAAGMVNGDATRFTCPNCGGKMSYSPDGQSLVCEYCQSRNHVTAKKSGGDEPEEDFILAMATGKAQLRPIHRAAFACLGCGAQFVLPPERLTQDCPYCESAHVLESVESAEWVEPGGVIPFRVNREEAADIFHSWLADKMKNQEVKCQRGVGIYLPAWNFEIGGVLKWRGVHENNRVRTTVKGAAPVYASHILISATKKAPGLFMECLRRYDLADGLLPYDDRYLAGIPAETYQVPPARAALDARARAFWVFQQEQMPEVRYLENPVFSSEGLHVVSYKMILCPVWMTFYTLNGKRYAFLINGQTGKPFAEKPETGLTRWFKEFLIGGQG